MNVVNPSIRIDCNLLIVSWYAGRTDSFRIATSGDGEKFISVHNGNESVTIGLYGDIIEKILRAWSYLGL